MEKKVKGEFKGPRHFLFEAMREQGIDPDKEEIVDQGEFPQVELREATSFEQFQALIAHLSAEEQIWDPFFAKQLHEQTVQLTRIACALEKLVIFKAGKIAMPTFQNEEKLEDIMVNEGFVFDGSHWLFQGEENSARLSPGALQSLLDAGGTHKVKLYVQQAKRLCGIS